MSYFINKLLSCCQFRIGDKIFTLSCISDLKCILKPIKKVYLWISFYSVVCIGFLMLSNISLASVQNNEEDVNVTNLISETISVLTSNNNVYSKNLSLLKNLKNSGQLNNIQSCYYNYFIGYKLGFDGSYSEALKVFTQLLDSCEGLEIKIRVAATMATLQVISRQYELALNSLDFAVMNIKNINNDELKFKIYSTASLVYRLLGKHKISIEFDNLLLKSNPPVSYVCKGLTSKYRSMLEINPEIDIDTKINYAIDLCDRNKVYVVSGFLKLEWLNIKLSLVNNDYNKISNILNELQLIENSILQTNYQNLIGVNYSLYAKIHLKLGKLEGAKDYALKTIENSKSLGNTKQRIVALDILEEYYKEKDNFKKSLYYADEKFLASKFNYSDEQAKIMAYQTIMHSNFGNKQEIKLLNQKNKVLALEKVVNTKSSQLQKMVILFLIAITSFFIFWGLWQKRNQRIYKELSERDHMTSIFNRKGLRKYTDSLLAYSQENDTQVGCAVFDLDWFKNINDQFGHATGDWAIKNVIRKVESLGNSKATFGRLGGEEFAIILSDANKEEMYVFCENCRNAINSLVTKESGHTFKISASFGMTTSDVSKLSYSDLLIHADVALYKAKKSGRNNTVIYQQ